MKLNNKDLHDFFTEVGVNYLFHANTFATSETFSLVGGLLSRGAVEAAGMHQTPQKSDSQDKLVEVWNDVFLDTTDLHVYMKRQNHYGPVL